MPDDPRKFSEAKIKLVANGYLIVVTDGADVTEQQFIAHDLDHLGQVLKAIMAPPPELKP